MVGWKLEDWPFAPDYGPPAGSPAAEQQDEATVQHVGDSKAAAKLRAMADKMQATIDAKLNPSVANLNYTRRRAQMAESLRCEGQRLERVQYALYGLAQVHEQGRLPAVLAKVTSKVLIEDMLIRDTWPESEWYEDMRKRLGKAGITPESYVEAHKALLALTKAPDRQAEMQAAELEAEAKRLVGQVPGFFPTPPDIAGQMLDLAVVRPGMTVLEPSAGHGAIADAIRERCPEAALTCIEINPTLSQLLETKGHTLHPDAHDFLALDEGEVYDRVIQNPPFEGLADVEHVLAAYKHLKPAGRLVSVMSESPFFRKDTKAVEFREWLDDVGGWQVDLPAGAFAASGTGVKTRLVIIDR